MTLCFFEFKFNKHCSDDFLKALHWGRQRSCFKKALTIMQGSKTLSEDIRLKCYNLIVGCSHWELLFYLNNTSRGHGYDLFDTQFQSVSSEKNYDPMSLENHHLLSVRNELLSLPPVWSRPSFYLPDFFRLRRNIIGFESSKPHKTRRVLIGVYAESSFILLSRFRVVMSC